MVTLSALYIASRNKLRDKGIENFSGEALMLCERYLGIAGRGDLLTKGDSAVPDGRRMRLENAVAQRLSGRPLQYILGSWEFGGLDLTVREGVLVPRQDTLALVDLCGDFISGTESPRILDLCAGTGAVGLVLLNRKKDAVCTFVEYSTDALGVLEENIARFSGGRGKALEADVLKKPEICETFDLICSNPPYISAPGMESLTGDVLREPEMALFGGEDGLDFYRAITSLWTTLLKPGGALAFEVGYDQSEEVGRLMSEAGFEEIKVRKDMAGIERAVIGVKEIIDKR